MIDLQKVEELREARKISKMNFYKAIGMSSTGFYQMIENNSAKLSKVQEIADVLQVPFTDLLLIDKSATVSEPPAQYGKEQTDYPAPLDKEMYLRWLQRQKVAGHLTLVDDMVTRILSHTAADLMISEKLVDLDNTRELRVNTAMRDTELYLEKRFLNK